jgi:hypothetical protein
MSTPITDIPPQGSRDDWRPVSDDNYGDGGAFQEIHVDQFPLGIGRIGDLVTCIGFCIPLLRLLNLFLLIQVPLTLLSGFLGAGKTTVLKHVLENQEGYRVGVIVNDVAEVNIDAKLIRQRRPTDIIDETDNSDTVELENGCACCTAGPDLMDSILQLVRLSIRRGYR